MVIPDAAGSGVPVAAGSGVPVAGMKHRQKLKNRHMGDRFPREK
tara:strand:- start:5180 stop:5311 length:132 start_codon:yes stop_codon:yes gene_type:complete